MAVIATNFVQNRKTVIQSNPMKTKPTIFFDLDDVLAHFNGYTNSVFGSAHKIGNAIGTEHWLGLCKEHPRMFRSLKPNYGAIDVLNHLMNQDDFPPVRILTALPFDPDHVWPYASIDKFRWCDEHLPGIPMFVGPYAHDKWKHCKPGDLLIDDKLSNCLEWENADGKAFLYRENNEEMMEWIKSNI